jgi:hypothetical protein
MASDNFVNAQSLELICRFRDSFRLDCPPHWSGNGLPLRGRTVMIEAAPNNAITALIHSLPTLPKERLVELWKENFGKTRVESARS